MKKISGKFMLISFLIMININFAYAEQTYYPYPIVFVHGLNSSDAMWRGMRDELRRYFWTTGIEEKFKYPGQVSENYYFVNCDYENQNNSHIPDIITRLSYLIDRALSYYPPEISANDRKVIIVCHSMGGLVTRSLLALHPSYQNKIFRVVFIDTPHLGSPYASILWLLNQVRDGNAQMDSPVKSITYNSYTAFSPLLFANKEAVERASIYAKIFNNQLHINLLLTPLDFTGPKPRGDAIKDLRTPAFTRYEATYSGLLSNFAVTLHTDYAANDTFLGNNNSLAVPTDYKVITGSNPVGHQIAIWSVDKLSKLSSPFTFSTLAGESQSLDNAIFNGDGIVTMSSQTKVGEIARADYQVSGFHVGVADNAIKETLEAIEDKPQIERIKVIALDESQRAPNMDYYIVVKIKEYLLADIELEYMRLNGKNIIPGNFVANMPYYAYPGRGFLKSRDGPEVIDILGNKTKIKLEPGEFFVKATLSPGVNTLSLKIKNPAEEFAQNDTFTDEVTAYLSRPIIGDVYFTFGDYPPASYGWGIDVPPYDEDRDPFIDALKNSGTLSQFTITDEAVTEAQSENMNVSASLYVNTPEGLKIINPLVVLKDEVQVLDRNSGGYSKTVTNFTAWDGKDKNGNYVPEWLTSQVVYRLFLLAKPTSADPYIYPHADPPVTKQLLLGTSWDTPFMDIISADPTFIQHSKELGIDFFSDNIQNRLKQRADRYRLSQRQTYEGSNYELASHLKELGAEKKVIAELESPAHPHKQNLTVSSRILP